MQANPHGNSTQNRFIRLPEVEGMVGLGKSAIYAKMKETPPTFPKPIKLSRRAVAWSLASVQAWIAAQIANGGEA